MLRIRITPTLGGASGCGLTSTRASLAPGERLAADAEARNADVLAKGRQLSEASVRDGPARPARAYRVAPGGPDPRRR